MRAGRPRSQGIAVGSWLAFRIGALERHTFPILRGAGIENLIRHRRETRATAEYVSVPALAESRHRCRMAAIRCSAWAAIRSKIRGSREDRSSAPETAANAAQMKMNRPGITRGTK